MTESIRKKKLHEVDAATQFQQRTGHRHAEPGDIVWQDLMAEPLDGEFVGRIPVKIVDWVSTDMARNGAPADGAVDASDMAYFFSGGVGQGTVPVTWGFDSEGGTWTGTWRKNVVNMGSSAGYIDASDIAHFMNDLSRNCLNPKSGHGDLAAIIAYFGLATTGEQIDTGLGILPEYEVIDPAKLAIAIADPYGYRNNAASSVREFTWSTVKKVYQ